jgi:8-oxo-dGTP pyrophosphatase MutT (NUDIX family)
MQRLVAGIVVRDGRILLVRRREGESFAGRWVLPEGDMQPGDPWTDAIVRAVRDDTGLLATVAERSAVPFMAGPLPGLAALCHVVGAAPCVALGPRLDAYRWSALAELSSPEHFPGLAEEVVAAMEAGIHGAI